MAKRVDTSTMRRRLYSVLEDHQRSGRHARAAQDLLSLGAMDKVIEWCAGKGIKVLHKSLAGEGGIWHPDTREIWIEPRNAVPKQVNILLHECGHALIDQSVSRTAEIRYGDGNGYVAEGRNVRPIDLVNVVATEIDAWNRGWLLAERLNVNVDFAAYEASKVDSVMSYMKWALRGKR